MIGVDYVQTMARYNAWQNRGLIGALQDVPAAELTAPRGAFFGSILGTLNHVLWADGMWMARLASWPAPRAGLAESAEILPTFAAWAADRVRADGRLIHWADTLRPAALRGDLRWHSGATGRDVTRPRALCVMHMFNHQTHHRGQVHAMMTAAGLPVQVTDLVFMDEGDRAA